MCAARAGAQLASRSPTKTGCLRGQAHLAAFTGTLSGDKIDRPSVDRERKSCVCSDINYGHGISPLSHKHLFAGPREGTVIEHQNTEIIDLGLMVVTDNTINCHRLIVSCHASWLWPVTEDSLLLS